MTQQPLETIQQIFDSQLQVLETVLTPSSMRQYRSRLNRFLSFLDAVHPEIRRLSQLRRDPHILGWLRNLHEHQPPLAKSTRLDAIVFVRRLLNDLAARKCSRIRVGLLIREDCPILDKRLPRTLSAEDDSKLDRQLREIDNLCSNGLLLVRATGMRISECLNLTVDSMRDFGQNQWAIKVPLGKLHNERWVPVDEDACKIFRRILSLRSLADRKQAGAGVVTLLIRKDGRRMSYEIMKNALIAAARQAGCSSRITPHRLRHTYATMMLRAGANLLVVKQLLGHKSIEMTLRYLEVSQLDLQREYHRARQEMRFPTIPKISATRENLAIPTLLVSVAETHHLMEMFRRQLEDGHLQRKMAHLINRLEKISSEISHFEKAQK
jgi:site-specific recombinase XerD